MATELSWRENISKLSSGAVEEVILKSRFLLVPLYFALLYVILTIALDFVRMLEGTALTADLTKHTLRALELIDFTMIANLIWLISAGSYYVFVDNHYPNTSGKKRPRSLAHVSSGLLKEKMAGSVVGISSVYLLHVFLNIFTSAEIVDWEKVGALLAIHFIFIVGLLAFTYTNSAHHHQHSEEKT
jgi:uncharacterized protein (TIGR00645 family)